MKALLDIFTAYGKPIADVSVALLLVIVAALLGLWAYFRQKEYELVRERYLENGIDLIVDQVASSLHIFQQNWTRCILILKTFRDLGHDTPSRLYSEPFLRVDPNAFLSTKHYLLQQLIRDQVFYDACQLLMVFLHDSTNTFENDLCSAVRGHIERGDIHAIKPGQRQQLVDTFVEHLTAMEKEAHKYWVMLEKLQQISFVLERQRFTFRRLLRFHKNKTVIRCVQNVTDVFGNHIREVKELRNEPRQNASKTANEMAVGIAV